MLHFIKFVVEMLFVNIMFMVINVKLGVFIKPSIFNAVNLIGNDHLFENIIDFILCFKNDLVLFLVKILFLIINREEINFTKYFAFRSIFDFF